MKKLFAIIAVAAVASAASAQTVTNLFPDGDFDHPAGTNGPWVETGGGTVWSYPTTGGNPGGYGVMDGTLGWGIWVGGNTTPLALGPLGLVAGNSYNFTMDMNQISPGDGTHPAGLKIESWGPGGKISDSGDMTTATAPGWQTYLFNYTIATGATGLKIVPLWETGGVDGYDNIGVIVPPQPLITAILSPDGTVTEPTTFTITATAVVSPGTITNVVFYDGTTMLGHSTSYPYTFNLAGATVGIHPLTVVAKASTGISATSAVVNVTVANLAPPAPNYPTNTPAAPTAPATNVIALYNSSGVYPDRSPINWYPWGAGGSFGDFVVANGKVVKSYLALQYAGVELNGGIYDLAHAMDLSGVNTMHIDVWTTANQMAIKMVSSAANAAAPELIYNAASGVITASNWVRLDIPLSAFTNINSALDLTHIDQLLWIDNGDIAGPGVQNGDFYFDNIYFYNTNLPPTTVYVDPSQTWIGYMNVSDLPSNGGNYEFGSAWGTSALPAVFNGSVLTLSPNVNTYAPNDPYWVNPDGSGNKICDASMYVENDNLAGNVVNFTGYCLSNTLVSPYTSTVFIKDFVPNYSSFTGTNVPLVAGTTFSITLATGAGDHIQYGFETVGPDANPATVASLGSVLVASNLVSVPPPPSYPTNNAPIPTRPAGTVLALYNSSGTYTDAANINFYPWGSATSATDYTIIGGRTVKSYLGLSYYGVEMNPDYNGGTDIDASAYIGLHVDVWTTANQLAIKLVSTMNNAAPELIYPASSGVITSNHWVSLDIPLAAFTNLVPTLDLTHLDQLLWVDNGDIPGTGVQNGNYYIDNVYYYSTAVAASPAITARVIGGALNMSFATQNGFNYTVQYKTNLTDAVWQALSTLSGNGSVQTVTDPSSQKSRFYRVSIQ